MRTLFASLAHVFLFFTYGFAQHANRAESNKSQSRQIFVEKSHTAQPVAFKRNTVESAVYIYDSKTSNLYHTSPSCRLLSKHSHKIVKLTRKEASQSLIPCKWCY